MQFSKEYDQWYLEAHEKEEYYSLRKMESVPKGTVLVCKWGKNVMNIYLFQSLSIKDTSKLSSRSFLGYLSGSIVDFAGKSLEFSPAIVFSKCRLPTLKELQFYNKLRVV